MHKRFTRAIHNHEGSLLLTALIVLGVIAVSTIYLSVALLQEIRNSRYGDNSAIAYYVAESGLERSIWRLKLAKPNSDLTQLKLFTGICTGGTNAGGSCSVNGDCTGGTCSLGLSSLQASVTQCAADDADGSHAACDDAERTYQYTVVKNSAPDFTAYDIPQNSPLYTDIYDPGKEGVSSSSTSLDTFTVNWYLAQCSSGNKRLEITYTPIDITSLKPVVSSGTIQSAQNTIVDQCGCDNTPGADGLYQCTSRAIGITSGYFYRISFRPLDTDVKKLVMTGSLAGASKDIPSQVQVVAVGSYREAQSKATLRTQWKDSLSGIFNYVVFSQESLIKDTKSGTGGYYSTLCGFCGTGVSTPSSPTTPCSTDDDCSATPGAKCMVPNTVTDTVDGSKTAAYCKDLASGNCYNDQSRSCAIDTDCSAYIPGDFCAYERYNNETPFVYIRQNNAGTCNAVCNGVTYCGDSFVQSNSHGASPNGTGQGGPGNNGQEECDNGAGNSDTAPNACRANCVKNFCGDGVVDDEVCRNRIWASGDSCSSSAQCSGTPCGEECDLGTGNNNSGTCSTGSVLLQPCTLTFCGDNFEQHPNGHGVTEDCDEGLSNGQPNRCPASCVTYCGNAAPGHCSASPYGPCNNIGGACTGGTCVADPDEECDDGNADNSDGCDTNGTAPYAHGVCKLTFCRDGIRQSPNGVQTGGTDGLGDETCDPGNVIPKIPVDCQDYCSYSCVFGPPPGCF